MTKFVPQWKHLRYEWSFGLWTQLWAIVKKQQQNKLSGFYEFRNRDLCGTSAANGAMKPQLEEQVILNGFTNATLGWVVQKLVNFNPGLSKNSRSDFFFKKRWTIL